jgi:hypothetical protein
MTPALVSHRAQAVARGCDITITRGGAPVDFRAIVGQTQFEAVGADAVTVHTTTDFIVAAEDWLEEFDEYPRRDDLIEWGTRTFEVRSPIGDKAFRFSDAERSVIRIYTTEVA